MLPYQRRSGANGSRTGEGEVVRPTTRPVAIPRSVRPPRPEIAPVRVDDEMTTMMPSKSASQLPPPPDAYTARIPRQWSPVGEAVPVAAPLPMPATMPSFTPPPASSLAPTPLSVPAPPSSLQGLSVQTSPRIAVDTARVRTAGLGKLARPTLSWAAALVALGIFVGIGSAFINRGEASAKTRVVATGKGDKQDKAKAALAAKAAPVAAQTAAKTAPPPPALTPAPVDNVAAVAPAVLPSAPLAQAPTAPPPLPPGVLPPGEVSASPSATGVVMPSHPAAPIAMAPPVQSAPNFFALPPGAAPMPAAPAGPTINSPFAANPPRKTAAPSPRRAPAPVAASANANANDDAPAAAKSSKKASAKEVAQLADEQLGLSL